MDRERLETVQLDRLKWQVKRSYECSEFYRERFDKIGLKPEDINSLDDALKIPPVIAEYKTKDVDNEEFKRKVKRAFREELEVTPGLELVEFGTLERTMFKAKRVEDQRVKALKSTLPKGPQPMIR